MLALGDQHGHKVTKLGVEPAAMRSRLRQRILNPILYYSEKTQSDECLDSKYVRIED